ncbi:hypothetical protein HOF92_10030 [bacterium]|nr:hypothetical protein [bacterium]
MNLSTSLIKEIENLIEEEAYEIRQKQQGASSPQPEPLISREVGSRESRINEETTRFAPDTEKKTRRRSRLHPIQRAIIFSEVLKKPGNR